MYWANFCVKRLCTTAVQTADQELSLRGLNTVRDRNVFIDPLLLQLTFRKLRNASFTPSASIPASDSISAVAVPLHITHHLRSSAQIYFTSTSVALPEAVQFGCSSPVVCGGYIA